VIALSFRVFCASNLSRASPPTSGLHDYQHRMVSVSRGSIAKPRQHREQNEALKPYEPPPSTMAAALINNLSTTNKPSRQNEQDDLKALWELSTMLSNAEEPSNVEAKVEHHHKLIYVFARLVLEPLASDDPFLDIQNVVSQASDAIDAFISAIKETPAVLAYIAKSNSFQGRGPEPLWVWLFPRMLVLLGRRRCDALTEKIKDIFFVSFQAVSRSPKLWDLPSLFFCYLKECATSTLGHAHSLVNITHLLSSYLEPPSIL
jgi:serine/threonine-protein kinase ATR